jgi:Thaumatin family
MKRLVAIFGAALGLLLSSGIAHAQVSCAGIPAFASCTAYATGASVVYNNSKYTSIAPIAANRDCPPNSPYNPGNDNWWTNMGTCTGSATATATVTATATPARATATATTARATATATTSSRTTPTATATRTSTATATRTPTATATTSGSTPIPTPAPGCVGCTHKRLKVINGCGQPIWMQYLNGNGGGTLNAPNRYELATLNSFIEYDIPDIGIAGVRFWPGMGCDANGQNCTIGASGGPASMGFTCPAAGCGPPVDSKFEASLGCMSNIPAASCQPNPSAPGTTLGTLDWWNTSAVDGYTLPFQVKAIGNCPIGSQSNGPGGPPGLMTSCANIRFADCPANENLSSNGQFPDLSSVNLKLTNPGNGAQAGCFSPAGKMTFSQWNAGFATYPPSDAHAEWYACPTPPITPAQCSAGPASTTAYRNVIHSKCTNTYAYAYDDTFGLATCPAAANMTYEVTFFCPQ